MINGEMKYGPDGNKWAEFVKQKCANHFKEMGVVKPEEEESSPESYISKDLSRGTIVFVLRTN